ncbi:MAG TPA: hypothetical protein VNX66_12965 [Candidatus Sulfotelmatobacter sp.]|jgi:hypothetical protein|nr:hypothetical protein [Candidatus Sulfotelmatobacter sp.]
MLIEELFGRGIMVMGSAKDRPGLQTGTFNMELLKTFPVLKAAEMEKMRWIEGEWNSVNRVPATSKNPAYEDVNTGTYRFCEKDSWICLVGKDGRERKYLTFDPFSGQWIYVLLEGAYGILRSRGWNGNEIAFEGEMTMIGVNCVLRQTWKKKSDDAFMFVNEEKLADGSWGYVDEWELNRK